MFSKPLLKLLLLLLVLYCGEGSGCCCDRRAFKSPEAENSLQLVCRNMRDEVDDTCKAGPGPCPGGGVHVA